MDAVEGAPSEILFYDFTAVPFFIQIFGGYVFLKRYDHRYLFSCVSAFVVTAYDLIMLVLCLLSIVYSSFHKRITMQLLQFVFTSLATLCIRVIFAKVLRNFQFSDELFRQGVYIYDVQDIGEQEIVRETLDETKMFLSIYKKIVFFTFFSLSFFVPLLKYLFLDVEDTLKFGVNPYLPLPIYMPFDTRSIIGYFTGLVLVSGRLLDLMCTGLCHAEVTMGMALQFSAQIKVLNFSLKEIGKRAELRFKRDLFEDSDLNYNDNLYSRRDFQECLYLCLRENVLHDQTILRLQKSLSRYLEATNSVAALFSSIITAFAVYAVSEENNFEPFVFVVPVVLGVLHMSWVGQNITDVSAETKNALFSTPWYNSRKEFVSLLKVLLSRSQEPIVLRDTCFKMRVSLESFGNLTSTAYKMVNVLR